jgi:hypothetical protein
LKKLILGFIFVITGIIFCASPMLAKSAPTSLYFDYCFLEANDEYYEIHAASIGGRLNLNPIVAGATYIKSFHNESEPKGVDNEDDLILSYVGFDFLSGCENKWLALVATYASWDREEAANDMKISSFGAGIYAGISFGSGYLSVLYSQGLDNEVEYNGETINDDPDFNLLEVSFGQYINETFGWHLAIRKYFFDNDTDMNQYCFGIEMRL